jgi:sucrose-phosphate synthase
MLLVCDIDGTLFLPDQGNPGLEDFNKLVEASRGRIILVLNSGRSLAEMAAVAQNGPIARPDWLICGVGTELYGRFDPAALDPEWDVLMRRDWGREGARSMLAGCPGLVEQEPERQNPGRLSYYFTEPAGRVMPEIHSRLKPLAGSIKLIDCLGHYLDIMPGDGGKGAPVDFLARRLGIPQNHIITAGDSGNDRDLLDRGWFSVVVANHAPELTDLAGTSDVYFASRPAAAGVLEGLSRFLQTHTAEPTLPQIPHQYH